MAGATVVVTPDKGPFAPGSEREFNASAPGLTVTAVRWESGQPNAWTPVAGATTTSCTIKVDDHKDGSLRAVVTDDQQAEHASAPVVIEVEAAPAGGGTGQPGETTPAEAPPVWRPQFAGLAALVLLALAVAMNWAFGLLSPDLGLGTKAYEKLDGRGLLAARVLGPLMVTGLVVTLIGVWMALTEWRGRFEAKQGALKGGADPSAVIEALGKLKGSALVLVSGMVILLGAAWATGSASSAPPATPTSPTSTADTTTLPQPPSTAPSPT